MPTYLMHYGVKGMKWGERRFQNLDGTLTPAGRIRYIGPQNYRDRQSAAATSAAPTRLVPERAVYQRPANGQVIQDNYNRLLAQKELAQRQRQAALNAQAANKKLVDLPGNKTYDELVADQAKTAAANKTQTDAEKKAEEEKKKKKKASARRRAAARKKAAKTSTNTAASVPANSKIFATDLTGLHTPEAIQTQETAKQWMAMFERKRR